MFFSNWLHRSEFLSPNKTDLIDTLNTDQTITYRHWNHRVDRLAHYKVPRSVVFLKRLPKTGANKVDKYELVDQD